MGSIPGEKLCYIPACTRTDSTDVLHEALGFRANHELTTDINIKKILWGTKKKKQ